MIKILLVEDNESIILGLEYLFEEEAFEYKIAKNKINALNLLEEKFDIILLDIEMPNVSGIQAFSMIRAMSNMDGVPVVFLTGKEDRNTVLRCISMGADGYMVKPVSKTSLLDKLQEIFAKLDAYKINKTILMIDDDADFLKISKFKLSKFYRVLTVDSGKTALERIIQASAEHSITEEAHTSAMSPGPAEGFPNNRKSEKEESAIGSFASKPARKTRSA